MTGNLYVISAPSGAGKTTLVRALVTAEPGLTVSVSHTTRQKRPAEVEGVNYYFVTPEQFQQMIDHDDFLEHATIFHNSYGTSKAWVEKTLREGKDVILEIDWQGCQQIQKLFPECIAIFILPPSFEALSERLRTRNQDAEEIIRERLQDARDATLHIHEYDYVVMNDHFEKAVEDLRHIVRAEQLVHRRQSELHRQLIEGLVDALKTS